MFKSSCGRKFSLLDQLLVQSDDALKTLTVRRQASRPNPAETMPEDPMTEEETTQAACLMRVNHTGEICAQALYRGQALTTASEAMTASLLEAADEEHDHLVWCQTRLDQLSHDPSLFNPFFYVMSFLLGSGMGCLPSAYALGFIIATEQQVLLHLENSLSRLPIVDQKSRAILEQMKLEEAMHAQNAQRHGGMLYPAPIRWLMTAVSRVMTTLAYRL